MNLPELQELREYSFEIGPIRPPSEGGSHSLLIRATRNCPWNLCKFCYGTPYNRERFQLRTVEEVKRDIKSAKAISNLIEKISERVGGLDWVARIIDPALLHNKDISKLSRKELENSQSVLNVFNWLCSGGKSAFLQDANSLVMPTTSLVEVTTYLKETFPSLERITSYARAKTLAQKSRAIEELRRLRKAGLTRLHVGLETGDNDLLNYVNKGVTSEEQVLAGKRAKKAGFELSEYWMPGLGGRAMSEQHARNTARALSAINPDFVRSRRFVPRKGTPLHEEWKKGKFQLLTPHEELREIKVMIKNLEMTGKVCFDHFINPAYIGDHKSIWLFRQDYEGYKFPDEKPEVLDQISFGLGIDESRYIHAESLVGMSL